MEAQLTDVAAEIGAKLIPFVVKAAGFVKDLATGFSRLPDPVQEAALGFGVLLAAVGPASYVFGAFSKLAGGVADVLETLRTGYTLAAVKALEFAEAVKAVGTVNAIAAGGLGATALALGAFAVAGLGVAAVSYGIVKALDLGVLSLDKWQKAGRAGAQAAIKDAGGSSDAYKALLGDYKNTGAVLDQYTAQLRTHGATLNARTADVDALRGAYSSGSREFQRSGTVVLELRQKYDDMGGALSRLKPKHEELVAQQKAAEAAAREQQRAIKDLASGTDDWTTATDDAKNAVLELQSAVLAAAGGELGLKQSQLNLTKAQQDQTGAFLGVVSAQQKYNDAVNQFGEGSQEALAASVELTRAQQDAQSADLDLEQARLGVANATLQAQDANQKLLDIVHQGPDAIKAETDKLKDAQRQHEDTSGAIQEQIDKLFWLNLSINGLPDQKGVKVNVDTAEALQATELLKRNLVELTQADWQVIVDVAGLGVPQPGAV